MGLRSIIKNDLVRVDDASGPQPARSSGHKSCAQGPSATIVELEGRARAIQVVCGCGTELLIELDFAGQTNQPS